MKCPKCGYLGFEVVERCRNCGYEFSLSQNRPSPELSLRERKEDANPLADLSFLKEAETVAADDSPSTDLPLFEAPAVDDEPLIKKASAPRQPLAVRRATPEVPRLRAEPRGQSMDLAFDTEPVTTATPSPSTRETTRGPASVVDRIAAGRHGSPGPALQESAGLVSRFLAVVIDLLILGIVDLLVVYFTMQICGIGILDLGILPKRPLFAFLALQNGGYLVGFTAGGQTLGKMALGIRVVTADEADALSVGRALNRTLVWAILAIPAGLGFLTALMSADRRGLHDRLAGTRVVRAAA